MSLANIWDKSNGVENRELPDGEYNVKVLSIETKETKNTYLPMIVWKTEILDGPAKGTLFINRVMDENKPFTIDQAKQDFLTLGFQPVAADMQATMAKLTGRDIVVKLNTNDKNFQNRNILGFAEGAAKTAEPVDDLPKDFKAF